MKKALAQAAPSDQAQAFVYADGYHAKVPASIVGPEILRLAGERPLDAIPAYQWVAAASKEDSPLHDVFEWDDEVAGHRYRCDQVRALIRHLRTVVKYEGQEDVVYRPLVNLEDGEGYRLSATVYGTEELRERLVQLAVGDLQSARRRLAELQAFGGIVRRIGVIERALVRAAATPKKKTKKAKQSGGHTATGNRAGRRSRKSRKKAR